MKIDDPELAPGSAAAYDSGTDADKRGDLDDLFMAVASRRPACRILDLGCGTGRITTALALTGQSVMGIDPNPEFLHRAMNKPRGERVAWVRGTSAKAPTESFDLALMSANAAQEAFITDEEWSEALADLRRALVAGGTLCFDTRDPAARAWESWGSPEGVRRRKHNDDGPVTDRFTTVNFVDDVAWFDWATVVSDGSQERHGLGRGRGLRCRSSLWRLPRGATRLSAIETGGGFRIIYGRPRLFRLIRSQGWP